MRLTPMTDQLNDSNPASPSSHPAFPQNLSPSSFTVPGEAKPETVRAILVDDDELYREAITGELEYHGFNVSAFATGEEMLAHLSDGTRPEVIVLDWQLESGLGLDLLPVLHERGIHVPVVFLTG